MFITQHYLIFSGWPEMRLLLALRDIMGVEKSNTMYYIPNAIIVNSESHGEFFFGSFIDRDVCFALINNMSQIAKRLIEIKRDSNTLSPDTEELIFGLRVPKETYLGGIQAKATASWNALPLPLPSSASMISVGGMDSSFNYINSNNKIDDKHDNKSSSHALYDQRTNRDDWHSNTPEQSNLSHTLPLPLPLSQSVRHPSVTSIASLSSSPSPPLTTTSSSSGTGPGIGTVSGTGAGVGVTVGSMSVSVSGSELVSNRGLISTTTTITDTNNYLKDSIEMSNLYTKSGIVTLCTSVLPYRFSDVLRSCWLPGSGYG